MSRLIDADALKEDIEQQCALLRLVKNNDELTQISMVLESGFMAQIDKMQTIEERKKGKWIHERLASTTGGSYPIVRCSVCQGTIPMEWETHYCPNCGADMRGET